MAGLTLAHMAIGTQTSKGAARAGRRILHVGSIGMLFGALLILVGSFLPWVSTPVGNLTPWNGTQIGMVTLSCGFIAIAGALIPKRTFAMWNAFVAGGLQLVLVLWQLLRLVQLSATTDTWGKLLPGIGLVLAAGGAVLVLRAGWRVRNAS